MDPETLLPVGEKVLPSVPPPVPQESQKPAPGVPSAKAQSWGVVISIVVIVLMITIGAFYAWGHRIAQSRDYPAALSDQ